MGTSTKPVCSTLPARAKTFVPPLAFRADATEPFGSVVQNGRNIGKSFHIIDNGGLAPDSANGGIWGPEPRLAALAFDGMDQGRFLAANKSARTQTDVDIEIETRTQEYPCPTSPTRGTGE